MVNERRTARMTSEIRKQDIAKTNASNRENDITARAEVPQCSVTPLMPITDPDALSMEGGASIVWNNTSPGLQAAANQLIAFINTEPGGRANIESAYRPQAYQNHLYEVWDKARVLKGNTSPECAAVRTAVTNEMRYHHLSIDIPVARKSPHTAGNAVDIDWELPNAVNEEEKIDELANKAGLIHPLHKDDRPHFVLGRQRTVANNMGGRRRGRWR